MSKEYRNRYIQKVMTETAEAIRSGFLLRQFVESYLRDRMKHYGIYQKYLPMDFKLDAVDTKETSNETIRVETSAS